MVVAGLEEASASSEESRPSGPDVDDDCGGSCGSDAAASVIV